MLKPCFDRESHSVSTPSDGPEVSVAPELSSVGIADDDKVTLALSRNTSVRPEFQDDQNDTVGISSDVIHGRLKNSMHSIANYLAFAPEVWINCKL